MAANGRENFAAVLHAPGDVRLEQRPLPVLGPREIVVEVRAVGVCGSDVHYYEHGRIGAYVVHEPLVLGHEAAGVVAEVGREVTRHRVGDRVTLEPGVPCGRCAQCRAGRYNLCADVQFFATPPVDGAFARYVTIHEDFAFPLPASLSDEEGALIEPLAVALYACWRGGVGAATDVLVTGAGPIGQLAVQTALALGAPRVIVTDVNPDRLAAAERPGVRTIDVSQAQLDDVDVEADVLLECSGAQPALAAGIRALRQAGTAVAVGMGPSEDATVPLARIQSRELRLTGTFRYANAYPAAIDLAATGRVDLAGLIAARFPLERAEDALLAGRRDPASIKAVVVPNAA